MNDICHICDKPFGRFEHRFLHMIKHIQDGIAVGSFDSKGNWWFRKAMSDNQIEVTQHIRKIFDHGEGPKPGAEKIEGDYKEN